LVIRFLGLTGLAAALAGLTISLVYDLLHLDSWVGFQDNWGTVARALETGSVYRRAEWGLVLLAAGLAASLIALVIEIVVISRYAAGRRSATGFNAVAQIAIALGMLVGINMWSYNHPARFDWTLNQQFTFALDVQERLSKLQGETTIVVYLTHQSFGQRTETLEPKKRAYVSAAEHKVIEKLKDLVEQFRTFGKQFKVVILDSDDWRNYDTKLDETTKDLPELGPALAKTVENTVFFASQGNVQRLTFNELFLLDRQASVKDGGNLVLLNQGVEPLVQKIEAIGEKRPRVGIAVIHEVLTSQSAEEPAYTMAGVRKALTARGFDTKDIVLKKWSEFGPPEPAVYTPDDGKLDDIEDDITGLDSNIRTLTTALSEQKELLDLWKKADLEELTKKFAKRLNVAKVTAAIRTDVVEDLQFDVNALERSLTDQQALRKERLEERSKLNLDSLAEQRRMSDMRAKLTWALADCDMLIIPRLTQRNVARRNENIPNWIHRLDDTQGEVIRDFIKSGKPVLFCLGPWNDPPERGPTPSGAQPDRIEQMLGQLGVKLPAQTILFDTDIEAFASRSGSPFGGKSRVEPPSVEFEWKPGAGRPLRGHPAPDRPEHPIRQSMKLVARSLSVDAQGKSMLADLRLRHPQPVYYDAPAGSDLKFDPSLMMTNSASWNEENPFPTPQRTPKYDPPKSDPNKGTVDEKRRGPFPIAAAFTAKLPADWYSDKNAKPADVRLVVIGSGGIFNGTELSPAREMLLLDSCNWLLGRDQELALREEPWKYPRVDLSPRAIELWRWFAWVGLPGLFAYLGFVVLLVRRVR
jgi:hypothetical protein